MIFVARLVVVMGGVVRILRQSPGFIVAFELHPFIDGKRWNADAREAEVIGAVIMSGFGTRVGTNLEAEILRGRLYRGIKRVRSAPETSLLRASRAAARLVIEIERNLARRNRGMFAEIFGAEQSLFFGGDGGKKSSGAASAAAA